MAWAGMNQVMSGQSKQNKITAEQMPMLIDGVNMYILKLKHTIPSKLPRNAGQQVRPGPPLISRVPLSG